MGRFSASLSGSKKVNNAHGSVHDKKEIRERVLGEMNGSAKVLDVFAGAGAMYRSVWKNAKSYVAIDQKWYPDERMAFVADNRRVLRCVDLDQFNVFDLDAYGSPWEQAAIVARRRKVSRGEKIAFVMTDGSSMKMRFGGMPSCLAIMAGISGEIEGTQRAQEDIAKRAVSWIERTMKCRTVKRWQAIGKTASRMRYDGIVMEGVSQ